MKVITWIGIVVVIVVVLWYKMDKVEKFGTLRLATPLDEKRSVKYALEQMCKSKGYQWVQYGDEFTYDCKHTKATCQKESVYPTQLGDNPRYYEWRDADTDDAKTVAARTIVSKNIRPGTELLSKTVQETIGKGSDYQATESEISQNGVCIIGNEYMREFCDDQNFKYDVNTGKCRVTEKYCDSKCIGYCKGDCFKSGTEKINNFLFGNSIGRTLSCAQLPAAIELAACKLSEKK